MLVLIYILKITISNRFKNIWNDFVLKPSI